MQDDIDSDRPLEGNRLPALLEQRADRPSLARTSTTAAFVSQLIAARDRIDIQRVRRRAPVETAITAYQTGAKIAVRRVPQGFRTTIIT